MDSLIDRLVLFETDSTVQTDYPHLLDFENIKGRKFTDRDWYLVEVDGKTGWVSGTYVAEVKGVLYPSHKILYTPL